MDYSPRRIFRRRLAAPRSPNEFPLVQRGGGTAASVVEEPPTRCRREGEEKRSRRRQLSGGGTPEDAVKDYWQPPKKGRRRKKRRPVMARYVETPVDLDVSEEKPRRCCARCDGPHEATACPWFRKERDKHPDARRRKPKELGSDEAPVVARRARVVPQPPDGSCLFHSLSFGLKDGRTASTLRRDIATFIRENPDLKIADTPLRDWIKWESRASVATYASRMAHAGWGGAIEMAAASELSNVSIEVYEPCATGFRRISLFHKPHAKTTVRVCYRGGVHYDALVL
ncbi:hypothetical protein CTAYLR_009645 [Chrysophaeum taylorii]|uniref:Ubiquitin thioesterase OTU n=1 Tax=Chrysophaeum taylorii TaxID=2483200 RepID=A0AAD7XGZ4_9STRA|nr:hypothetical protein CTAYLR_009645 [Chrysophaeum taylorii]